MAEDEDVSRKDEFMAVMAGGASLSSFEVADLVGLSQHATRGFVMTCARDEKLQKRWGCWICSRPTDRVVEFGGKKRKPQREYFGVKRMPRFKKDFGDVRAYVYWGLRESIKKGGK